MFATYDYWSSIFSPNREYSISDWNILKAVHKKHPELEGYMVFGPSYKLCYDNNVITSIPAFCSETFLTLPSQIAHSYQFAYAMYVLPGERQLRTKKDFAMLKEAITSGHIVKVRTSTNCLYYLHSNFILNEKKKVLVMPYFLYFYNKEKNTGFRRVKRELYVNPVIMSYKNDFIKRMVVRELMDFLALFSCNITMYPMKGQKAEFYDINKAGFSFDIDTYHDMLSNMLKSVSLASVVVNNLQTTIE